MDFLWPALLMASCLLALRLGPLWAPKRALYRRLIWLSGYTLLLAGAVATFFMRGLDLNAFISNPSGYFSWPLSLCFIIGFALLLFLETPESHGDDFGGGDDSGDDFDPWGPDFDQARALWARNLDKIKS